MQERPRARANDALNFCLKRAYGAADVRIQ